MGIIKKKLITIAICTYNRNELLEDILKRLSKLKTSEDIFDILVIDNFPDKNKIDYLIKKFKILKNIKFSHSSPPGLSIARNHAIQKCKTKYIAFIDDDATPSIDWINQLLSTFHKYKAHAVGGPIEPIWPHGRPDWVPSKYEECLTILSHGNSIKKLDEWHYLYGTNMAFNTSTIQKLGGFDIALGRKGSISLLSDEEISLQKIMDEKKFKRYYNPKAIVKHSVHLDRLRQTYLRSRMAWQAVSDISQEVKPENVFWELADLCSQHGKLEILNLFHKQDEFGLTFNMDILIALQKLILSQHLLTDEKMERLLDQFFYSNFHSKNIYNTNNIQTFDINKYTNIDYLFVDSTNSHSFLYDGLSEGLNSSYLQIEGNTWNENFSEIKISAILNGANKPMHIFFITLDSYLWGRATGQLSRIASRFPRHKFSGIIHRSFDWFDKDIIKNNVKNLHQIFVVNPFEQKIMKKKYDLKTTLIDIPTAFSKMISKLKISKISEIRNKRNLKKHVFIFSGELREGKGLDIFFDAIRNLENIYLDKMSVIFSGSTDMDVKFISDQLERIGIHFEMRFKSSVISGSNRLDDFNLGLDLFISDYSLLLYNEKQLNIGSASLSNSINANCEVIATEKSYVGKLVKQNNLGFVVKNAHNLKEIFMNIIDNKVEVPSRTAEYKKFKNKILPASVAKTLKSNLNNNL